MIAAGRGGVLRGYPVITEGSRGGIVEIAGAPNTCASKLGGSPTL